MKNFIHLHTHTHHSILSSHILPSHLFQRAKELNMKSVAITDYASMFNMPLLFEEAKKEGIKLIIGSEIFLTSKNFPEKPTMILLVKNNAGYHNLSKILSSSSKKEDDFYPSVDEATVLKYANGLICLSGGEKGELAQSIVHHANEDREKNIAQWIKTYQPIFGDDLYLQLENHSASNDKKTNDTLIQLSQTHNIKLVATNNVFYLKKKDAPIHDILLAIKNKQVISNPNRVKFPTDEYYFKSADEMSSIFPDEYNEISNTIEIEAKCEFQFSPSPANLPHFPIPKEFTTDHEFLRHEAFRGVKKKYGNLEELGERGDAIKERIEYELNTIIKMGYSSYFLIVSDLIQASREMGYSVGPGRGSAAGCIVAYLLDITLIDPLEFGLLFERFLNPDRASMPDIDIDFTPIGKQKVLDYTIKKYGSENVAKIITFSTFGAKAVLKDVGRVLEISFDEMNYITKQISFRPGITLKDSFQESTELQDMVKRNDEKINKLLEFSYALEGRMRNLSVHAGGVVICNGGLSETVPLYETDKIDSEDSANDGEKQIVTQFDKDWIEHVGLLKIDYLGLTTLEVIDNAIKLIEENYSVKVDLEKLPFDDKSTYKIFQNGKMSGIFQFESSGMQSYMVRLNPAVIGDIIAMSALYRPGALSAQIDKNRNAVDLFIDRKSGKEKVDYLHPLLEEILKETYGVFVYQEQVMLASQTMGGFTPAQADYLRKAMGKKQPEIMKKFEDDFINGAETKGVSRALARKVFDLMKQFSGYGFNKSHSAAYGVLAYWTAYLKSHYTPEFMVSILNSEIGDGARIKSLLDEAKGFGISVLPVNINKSEEGFSVENANGSKAIRVGLKAVKNVSVAAKEIADSRKEKGIIYDNLFDFCLTCDMKRMNKRVIESLIESGAMSDMDENRAKLFANVSKAIELTQQKNKSKKDQMSFFDDESFQSGISYPPMEHADDWDPKDRLTREQNVLGFVCSNHPLEEYKKEADAFATLKLSSVEIEHGKNYRIMGMVSKLKKYQDKKGATMLFGEIEDFDGKADFTMFASVYDKFKDVMQDDTAVMFQATAERKDNKMKLLVNEVVPMKNVCERFAKKIIIRLNDKDENIEKVANLKSICSEKGKIPIEFEIEIEDNSNIEKVLFSTNIRISPNREVIQKINELIGSENYSF